MELNVCAGFEPQNEFKVWETGDNRSSTIPPGDLAEQPRRFSEDKCIV